MAKSTSTNEGKKSLGRDVGEGEAMRETDRAILVFLVETGGKAWVPKSQIHEDSEIKKRGDTGILIVSDWLGKKLLGLE